MENFKRSANCSSDSENPTKRARIKEEIDTKHNLDHVIAILNREFQTEINTKQEEIKTIQNQVLTAHKTLHLLKYAIIKSFYDKKELKVPSETIINNSGENEPHNFLMQNQNRIHPAVKKIIGKQPLSYEIKRTRNKIQPMQIKQEVLETPAISDSTDLLAKNVIAPINEIDDKNNVDLVNKNPIRNRQKTKHLIIVGNVSKWLTETNSKNNTTHKWMVYIRGPRDNPDVSHIVKKVRFFLHPSYHPNDIVELEESPFHLSRRGWGEFPLRVQLHFQCSENKPVDIIHNLKLDRTYTGRQTLGNETLVNLWLINNNIKEELPTETDTFNNSLFEPVLQQDSNLETYNSDLYKLNKTKLDNIDRQFEPETFNFKSEEIFPYTNIFEAGCSKSASEANSNKTPFDHINYCSSSTMQVNTNENSILEKTNISLTEIMKNHNNQQNNTVEENIVFDNNHLKQNLVMKQEGDQHFIVHDGKAFLISKPKKKKPVSLLKRILKKKHKANQILEPFMQSSKEIISRDNDLVYLEDHCYSIPKLVEKEPLVIDREKYKINIPLDKLETAEKVVYFLFKSLPLITKLSNNISYTCCYPYVAASLEEYSSWNIAKRTCSEWFRAKVIKKLLISHNITNHEQWTMKILLMYGRAHAFTPLCNYDIFKNKTESGKTIPNRFKSTEVTTTFTEYTPISVLMQNLKCHRKYEDDCIVDVESTAKSTAEVQMDNSEKIKEVIEDHQIFPYAFIRKTAKTIGIQLKPEEISPNLWINSSECVLLKSIMCFAEEIIRKAWANNIIANRGREVKRPIDRNDVMKVLLVRPEFDLLLNTNLGKTIDPPS